MNGDNLLTKQPLKLYSQKVTDKLLRQMLEANAQMNELDLDQHHKEWGKNLAEYCAGLPS